MTKAGSDTPTVTGADATSATDAAAETAPGPPAGRALRTIGGAARAALLVAGGTFALSPLATPALALAAGIALALSAQNPWREQTNAASAMLLQASVVGLGFGIPMASLFAGGATGLGYTVVLLGGVVVLGTALKRVLRIEGETAVLIGVGTGICGGSAIAAVGPGIGASRQAMSIALATVFVLNGVALYVFPPVGHLLGLSEHQFGVWAALAIHDTSSVVGAAASYGAQALNDATTLKLARALWILPIAALAPMVMGRATGAGRRVPIPWFIALFVLASAVRAAAEGSGAQGVTPWLELVVRMARGTLVLTLFLIGAGLTRAQVQAAGARPFVFGVLLWIAVGGATLAFVWWGLAP